MYSDHCTTEFSPMRETGCITRHMHHRWGSRRDMVRLICHSRQRIMRASQRVTKRSVATQGWQPARASLTSICARELLFAVTTPGNAMLPPSPCCRPYIPGRARGMYCTLPIGLNLSGTSIRMSSSKAIGWAYSSHVYPGLYAFGPSSTEDDQHARDKPSAREKRQRIASSDARKTS